MTLTSGIFNSVNGDRKYNAQWFASYFASFIANGVFPNPSTGLQVVGNTNMTTVVNPGQGWINGYYLVNDANYILTHDVADGVLKRIDRVVMRLNFLTRQIEVLIKKGTFASSPVAPVLQRNTDAYELALADVLINNGATVITQANITDQRLNTALCGIVHGVVDQVDTTAIFNQYQAWFGEFTVDKQADFEEWMETLKDILDGDVAANLASRITSLEGTVASHLAEDATLLKKGHVQLNSSVTSTSETLAATSKAVKTAMDRADAAFQQANNGKIAVANAVTAKGVSASPADTFSVLATKIGQINTGSSKGANGRQSMRGLQFGASYYDIAISGLTFRPKHILITWTAGTTPFRMQSFVEPLISQQVELKDNGFVRNMYISSITPNNNGFNASIYVHMDSYSAVGTIWDWYWYAWD